MSDTARKPTAPPAAQPWKLTLLLDRQSIDWQQGLRAPVESYLEAGGAQGPDPETILNLIYHEVLLRRRLLGEVPGLEEYTRRFPALAEQLAVQFALDEVLHTEPEPPVQPAPEGGEPLIHIPGYTIHEVLGRGGMGVVYRARQIALNRTVALKMILGGVHAGPRQTSRFRTEAELIARLQHPNIVQIHEIGEYQGRPFLALEFVEGGTLDRLLAGTPLPAGQAVELVETLARAVAHAHERGVVHRDLKPANVLLTRDRQPRIADFGLAKLWAEESHQSDSGALVGTPSYMAPEQVEGMPSAVGPATDIYALGAILYEALTGRPPFRAESPMATMLQVRGADLVPPRHLRPGLSRHLETICLKCLEKDARYRYESALDLADDLRRFREGRPILARPVPPWERLWLWAGRQRALAAALLLGVAATGILVAGGIVHSVQLNRLNRRLSESNQELSLARAGAEQNARDAVAAITQMLVHVADQRLSGVPEAEPVRRELLKEALAKLELLAARNPEDPEIRHEMGKTYLAIAAIHRSLGEYSGAADHCRLALALLEPLLKGRSDQAVQITTASAHAALADLLDPDQGRAHFLRAETLWKPLAERDSSVRGHLARLYYGVAGRRRGFGRGSPEDFYAKAVEILEPLAREDPKSYHRDLARAVHNQGLAQSSLGRQEAAVANFRRALNIWEAMPPDQRTEDDELGIVACQNALGLGLQELPSSGSPSEAEAMLRQAVESCQRLARKHPGRFLHRDALARAWSNLGSFYFKAQRNAEAEPCYLQAIEASESNRRDFPEVPGLSIQLAHNFQDLAAAESGQGKRPEARTHFTRALEVLEPILRSSPGDFRTLQCLATILLNQGNLVRAADGAAAALPIQRRCVQAYEDALRALPNDAYTITCVIGARGNLSSACQTLGRFDEALEQVDRMIALTPGPDRQRPLKIQRALILVRAGRHEPAVATAAAVAREPGVDGESLYNLACVYAQAVKAATAGSEPLPDRDRSIARGYTAEALRLVARSAHEGHFPRRELLELLANDTDLEPIRGDGGFQSLAASLRRE